ncbi:hypothetical protein GQC79_000474 [Salmonella enterica]|nr:hypothetical protein [Salmonella enterica]
MSNIDKQALREAAEKATRGPWEMERENTGLPMKMGIPSTWLMCSKVMMLMTSRTITTQRS